LTKCSRRSGKRLFIPAHMLLLAGIVLSCGEMPNETGEIVIRAEDLAAASLDTIECQDADAIDSLAAQPVLPDGMPFPPDTLPPDTLHLSDSLLADSAGIDSLSADSLDISIDPMDIECPWNTAAVEINGSIYTSIQDLCEDSDILGAHIVRCMWWNTDPWRGMNAGDSLYLVFGDEGIEGRENRIAALRYVPREGTVNTGFAVYAFLMSGDNYASHYYSDGTEMMKLLDVMPIATFEEMTGPYGEPRGNRNHMGVDYKAPAGTPVRTCRGGTVARVNWNHDYNGNCIEIDMGGGYSEIFLHLQDLAEGISAGVVLSGGTIVGFVGNTGRTSTATHLHYQINDENSNPIDPYLFYGSHRRSLSGADLEAFREWRDRCDAWMSEAVEQ